MNTAKTFEDTKERIFQIHKSVYQQMINKEKNGYDPDIILPSIQMLENVPLKKSYNVEYKDSNTHEKQRRRENRPGILETHLKNNRIEQIQQIIIKAYCASITEIAQHAENICSEKTARTLIKKLFTMIGYSDIKRIPRILIDDLLEIVSNLIEHTKTIYNCCSSPDKILDYMNEEIMKNTYKLYLLSKKIILIECTNETDYKERIRNLHTNKKLNAVYAAVKELL